MVLFHHYASFNEGLFVRSFAEEALKIVKFEVPGLVSEGSDVQLSCLFELSGYMLYSVKWYKDDTEFYSFTPRYTPPIQAFHTEGVDLDVSIFLLYIRILHPLSHTCVCS